ncbi:exonuclease 1 isoform X2 [Nymphalis io]|uniref:exonuclease 1 isoform X2 n=1 Tax=Inachis io TaxID=171585 RepID=UPI0021673847|nr:exonuclease 1 isoform X2 [Nymphalis io]
MGITGLIPFLEKASRKTNISEFSGSTVAIDTYCWLHKGAFACAEKLVRGEDTDVYVKYCLKYVTMLLSKNIKPILVFDGRHLPAKAMTESKRRESRQTSKKRAAELLSLGKIEEARSFIRRSVDITHSMALALIKECRKRNVDCIVAPYEADAQLAYLNVNNYAQLVITEDSDLILFGCTKVLFKMDLDGTGTLVETAKLPLVMKCPIEHYTFDKFRQMCILSGCDYLASLPGIGLAKARQFVTTTQDSNFANALRKLPSFFNRSNLTVSDEYRENFLKAEATFKHQYVYDPIDRKMVRLTEPDDEDIETALCGNAGELLEPEIAFQLALGNLEPFTLKKLDDWHPDHCSINNDNIKTTSWNDKGVSNHPSIWSTMFREYLNNSSPWAKKVKKQELITSTHTRARKKVVTLVNKYVPETQDQSLSIETLSNMYRMEPATKKQKIDIDNPTQCSDIDSQNEHNIATIEDDTDERQSKKSPILENKRRSFKKCLRSNSYSVMKKLSNFPRTVIDQNVIESKFFNSNEDQPCTQSIKSDICVIEESPEKSAPFKTTSEDLEVIECSERSDSLLGSIQNSLSPVKYEKKAILEPSPKSRNPFKLKTDTQTSTDTGFNESVVEDTCGFDSNIILDSQISVEYSPTKAVSPPSLLKFRSNSFKRSTCRATAAKKTPLPSNQPTLLSMFGFQKKPALKR